VSDAQPLLEGGCLLTYFGAGLVRLLPPGELLENQVIDAGWPTLVRYELAYPLSTERGADDGLTNPELASAGLQKVGQRHPPVSVR
jgi:hypothetical protein